MEESPYIRHTLLPDCPGDRRFCTGNNGRGKCKILTDTKHISREKPCKFYDDGSKAAAAERRLKALENEKKMKGETK